MEVNKKTYELSSNLIPIFSGTYGSIWEINEYDDAGDPIEIEYDHSDLMYSIADLYQQEQEYITSEIKEMVPFIDKIIVPGSYSSPREYNFKTDVINLDVTIDIKKLNTTLKELENDDDFHKFLKDNYSSYDGFWSYTPDNYIGLKNEILTEGSEAEQSLAAIINYLVGSENYHEDCILRDIEEYLQDLWSGNGYNGLDYKICTNFIEGQKVTLKDDPDKKVYKIIEITDIYAGMYDLQLDDDDITGKTISLQDDDLEAIKIYSQNESLF